MKKKVIIIYSIIIGTALVGLSIFYYSNHGKKNGEYISYYKNGQIKEISNYKEGIPVGEFISYYENGQIKEISNYKEGIPVGEFISYYENGQLQGKCEFKTNWYGECDLYDKNGNFEMKGAGGYSANWKINGEGTYYYENGNIAAKGNFKNGQPVGEMIHYNENGEIEAKMSFKNGIYDGKHTYYYQDGKITEINFKNGKLDGIQTGYYEDGSIRFSGIYEKGIGTRAYFDKNGNLIGTGEEIFTDEFDEEKFIYKSILNGLEINYRSNGKIHNISNYKEGKLDGIKTICYKNGQIKSICKYNEGVKGECLIYDEN